MAVRCSIYRAPDPLRCLALLGEPIRHILLSAEVHLVRRASPENSARDLLVELAHVERRETPHCRGCSGRATRVSIVARTPRSRVRGDDVDLRKHTMQRT